MGVDIDHFENLYAYGSIIWNFQEFNLLPFRLVELRLLFDDPVLVKSLIGFFNNKVLLRLIIIIIAVLISKFSKDCWFVEEQEIMLFYSTYLLNQVVDSLVEWLECRDTDRHGLHSKPTRAVLLCPWERHFMAYSPAWWSLQAVLNLSHISINF